MGDTKNTNLSRIKEEENDLQVNSSNQVEALIAQAIDKKVPVETMEKLLSMRRELKKEWAEEQFNTAMAEFQNECPIIEKGKAVMNTGGQTARYKYAPLEEIVRQAGPVIAKHGFSYIIKAKVAESVVKANVKVTHKYGHSDESEFEVPIDPKAFMNEQQKFASALTYAKRYAFCNAFGIMTGDEDDDSNANSEENKPKQPAKQTTQAYVKPKAPIGTPPPVNKSVNKIPDNERIMILLKKLGYEPITKEEVVELIKQLTLLDLIPGKYKEIINRLEVLLDEIKLSSNNNTKVETETIEGVIITPPVKKKYLEPCEKISAGKLTVLRTLAKTNCCLSNDSEIKQFYSLKVDKLEDLSFEEGEALLKKLMISR